jgi:hypothetical protein
MGSLNIKKRASRVVVIMIIGLVIGVSCAPVTITSLPSTALPTLKPTKEILTPTSFITITPLKPTEIPESKHFDILVPGGNEATIDGVLSPEEWDPAYQTELIGGGELLLMHEGGYLYLGIRAKPEPVTSICLDRGDRVSILQSSAAIGTATYQQGDEVWEMIRGFKWCCREIMDSPQAQELRSEHLQQNNWMASNGRMGAVEDVEYKIGMPDDLLRLAVT